MTYNYLLPEVYLRWEATDPRWAAFPAIPAGRIGTQAVELFHVEHTPRKEPRREARTTCEELHMNDDVNFVLDQADDGEWLVWDRSENVKHRMGRDKLRVTELIARLNSAHRPNVENADGGMRVCWNDHDEWQMCEYELIPRVPSAGRVALPAKPQGHSGAKR